LTGSIHIFEGAVQLPRLGRLRLKERGYLPVGGVHLLSATVSERGGRWFVSVHAEVEIPDPTTTGKEAVGIDLGLVRLATVSDGTPVENPRALKRAVRRIQRLQRQVSRRKPGSANRGKAVARLAKVHLRVANLRKDTLHQVTSRLAKTKSVIVLEDLNVSGMLANHHLAQAIADASMYEFRRQLTYKGKWYGCQLVTADRFFPSTKRCSHCGHVKPVMDLAQRSYVCEVCQVQIDRDLNAALNLLQWYTASSAGIHACGEAVRPGLQADLGETGTEPHFTLYRFDHGLNNAVKGSDANKVISECG
jgi:putative transposase